MQHLQHRKQARIARCRPAIAAIAAIAAIGILGLITASGLAAQTTEEIEVSQGELLEIDLETGGTVAVSGWDRDLVSVEAQATGSRPHDDLEIRRTGKGVLIRSEHSHDDRHHDSTGFRLEIRVPLRFDLSFDTMGGSIQIEDVEGSFEGQTMGGELNLTRLKGDLDLTTMGGNISLTESEVNGEVTTMGGKVLLENVMGDVEGTSMGGNVVYRNVTRPDGTSTGNTVIISTMGGDIDVGEAFSGAKLHTMGGDITLDDAADFVEAETMGGDIELKRVDGHVDATTMGGDIEVRIVGDPQASGRDVSLESMSGEIHLTVPRNFAMNVDIELSYTKGRQGRYEIHSDMPLRISESDQWTTYWGSHDDEPEREHRGSSHKVISGTGSFNGGGNTLKIRTINGNVYLKYGG